LRQLLRQDRVEDAKVPIGRKFGHNLRRYRWRAELSQETLAMRSTLHRTEVALLETGRRIPRIDTIMKLAASLAVSPDELLAGIKWDLSTEEFRIEGDAVR
jgi:transcriptional regulator with XRE-family HTH domain